MLSFYITEDSEGILAPREHGNSHLKSYELTFVIHTDVAKSKWKMWELFYSIKMTC